MNMISNFFILFNDWHPMPLTHCLDCPVLAKFMCADSMYTVFIYLVIARMWWKSARMASAKGNKLFVSLTLIFLLCACCGYLPTSMAFFSPKFGILFKNVTNVLLNGVATYFVFKGNSKLFVAVSQNEAIGAMVTSKLNLSESLKDAPPHERLLAILAEVGPLIDTYTKNKKRA